VSTSWNSLGVDPAFRDIDAGPDASSGPELPADGGQWPEEVDIEVVADTARTIPGQGERPAGCGEWYPREFCPNCGQPHFGESRCGGRSCPKCWSSWTRDRTKSETIRLAAARHVESGVDARAVHCVVSPPAGTVTTESDLRDARKQAYRLAEKHGVRGGMAIEHGYRVKEEVQEVFAQLKAADLTEHGLWKWIREHRRDWRRLTYWSPHFHIIGLCRDFKPNSPDEDDGYVVQRLSTVDHYRLTDPNGYESMVRCTWYQLSHATFNKQTNSHAITWFGELAYNKFSPEQAVSAGVYDTIERFTEEALDWAEEEEEDGEGLQPDGGETCERDGCQGQLKPIWEAGLALQDPGWCENIGRQQQRKLTIAWEWAIGDVQPPPGMKQPQTRQDCEAVFTHLFNDRYGEDA
jgi:hypothetical protein